MTTQMAAAGYRVLIVDDERVIADTLAVILRQAGYQATTAYDGREALDKGRLFQPDLLISDIVMPDMDGIELAIRFTREAPACRVLLISGHAAYNHVQEHAARDGHTFPVIVKPIHPRDLLRKIADCQAKSISAGKS